MRGDQIVCRLEPSARALVHGAVADGHHETSRQTTNIRWSVDIKTDMTEVPGASDGSLEEAAVDDGGAADAGTECEKDSVLTTLGRAEPDLAEQCGMSVV